MKWTENELKMWGTTDMSPQTARLIKYGSRQKQAANSFQIIFM